MAGKKKSDSAPATPPAAGKLPKSTAKAPVANPTHVGKPVKAPKGGKGK